MTARPPEFDDTTSSWNTYRVRLEAFFEGHSIKDPGKQRALLVSALSDNVVRVLQGQCQSESVNHLSYEAVVQHLDNHFDPQVNEIAASYAFFHAEPSRRRKGTRNGRVEHTHKGSFAYNRLASGIASAPALFQRRLESVRQGLSRVKVYLDDIIIAEKQNSILRHVLGRPRDNGLKLNRDKCRFLEKQVSFLGHKIDATGLHPPENMEAITDAPRPETQLAGLSRSDDTLHQIRGWITHGWPRQLSVAQQHLMPYFSRRNETTPLEGGKSPAELLLGFRPRTRLTASLTKVTENDGSGEPVQGAAKEPTRYQPGSQVWSRQFQSARKWMPATVVSRTGVRMVTLETPEGPQRRHVDQLRPRFCTGSSPSKPSEVQTGDEAQCSAEQAAAHDGSDARDVGSQAAEDQQSPHRSTRLRKPPDCLAYSSLGGRDVALSSTRDVTLSSPRADV
ncbi:uncharacterized protein LOC142573853 [Dermacentor variabilis]|uniref:uncharacterized protein LOC142573853 n=1 Tax=Dermacentor variabilis TaxID=34621 RepID=UPI003F5C6E97